MIMTMVMISIPHHEQALVTITTCTVATIIPITIIPITRMPAPGVTPTLRNRRNSLGLADGGADLPRSSLSVCDRAQEQFLYSYLRWHKGCSGWVPGRP